MSHRKQLQIYHKELSKRCQKVTPLYSKISPYRGPKGVINRTRNPETLRTEKMLVAAAKPTIP